MTIIFCATLRGKIDLFVDRNDEVACDVLIATT